MTMRAALIVYQDTEKGIGPSSRAKKSGVNKEESEVRLQGLIPVPTYHVLPATYRQLTTAVRLLVSTYSVF